MIDVSTPHFLYMLRLIGGNLPQLYTEMYHASAIINMKENNILDFRLGINNQLNESDKNNVQLEERENNIIQLGGSCPIQLSKASEIVSNYKKFNGINLNLGCPSQAVQAGQFGAILMKDPIKVINLIHSMTESVNDKIPITVKCRLGVDDLDSEQFIFNFIEQISNNTKVNHFVIHARKCLLKGLSPHKNRTIPKLNYERVYKLAKTFKHLKFTINGGINSIQHTLDHLNVVPNLDGVMLGRKIMNDPLFLQCLIQTHYPNHQPLLTLSQIYYQYVNYYLLNKKSGHRPSFLIQPLMHIFQGKLGKTFRTKLQQSSLMKEDNDDEIDNRRELIKLVKEIGLEINE